MTIHDIRPTPVDVYAEWVGVTFWIYVAYREFFSSKPKSWLLKIPCKFLRLIAIVATLGFLAGCANPDPLAVASGPVFALNAGHWQPTQQDLAAPPAVTDK